MATAIPTPRPSASTAPAPAARAGYFRWTICGLLFLASTINYVDRQVIGLLKPTLDRKSTRLNSSHNGQPRMPSSA